MTDFNKIYDDFLADVGNGSADGRKAADALVRMSRVYSEYNDAANAARKTYALKLSEITQTLDPATNKPMTSAKAEILADASPENASFLDLRTALENICVYLSAIKYFQSSLTREYGNSANV